MSQDERTSQPVSDLGEESAAGTVHDSISGTDAGAVGGFDEDASKTENTEMEVDRSAVAQEAAELSRAILNSVTQFLSAIRESAANASAVIQASPAKFLLTTSDPDEVRNIIHASTRLSITVQEAQVLIGVKNLTEAFLGAICTALKEFSSAIQELKQFSSSFQEARADTLRAVQEATAEILSTVQDPAEAEFFSTVQESTIRYLITTFETGIEASRVVHAAADESSPFQEGAVEESHVVQETGTVESHTEDKSSPDSPETEHME